MYYTGQRNRILIAPELHLQQPHINSICHSPFPFFSGEAIPNLVVHLSILKQLFSKTVWKL